MHITVHEPAQEGRLGQDSGGEVVFGGSDKIVEGGEALKVLWRSLEVLGEFAGEVLVHEIDQLVGR